MEEFRQRHLPMDVIVQDWQYWGKYGWGVPKFDETNYPEPEKFIRQLHDLNASPQYIRYGWSVAQLIPTCLKGRITIASIAKTFSGRSLVELPGKPYIAVRIQGIKT